MENNLKAVWRGRAGKIVLAAAIAFPVCVHAQATRTPIPKVTGPVAVTSTSYPFARASGVDLAKSHYVEEEFLVSGSANVYEYGADKAVRVRTPNAPYATRILVRRPSDPKRFSGRVVVEIVNMSRGWDLDVQWEGLHEYLLRSGDIYVGVTSKPNAVKALKAFDPARYSALSWSNPLPLSDPGNCEVIRSMMPSDSSRETENGLVWDVLSQVGALLKSSTAGAPLAKFAVTRTYLVGYSQSGMFLRTYSGAIHPLAKLANGKPVYDGYIIGAAPGPVPLNQCAPQIEATDPRYLAHPSDVPVIAVITQSDVIGLGAYLTRRPDSDAPDDRFRLYEVPGASHGYAYPAQFEPPVEDIKKAGFNNRWSYDCAVGGVPNDFPSHYIFDGALASLDRWVKGTPPPRASRLEIDKLGTPEAAYKLDRFGNALGGVRTPYVDVPIARYYETSGPGECRLSGHKINLDRAQLRTLYSDHQTYLRRVTQQADQMTKDGWLTQEDAGLIKAEAAKAQVP